MERPANPLKSFMLLDEMLVPKVITVIYWLAIAYSIVSGFRIMFGYGPVFYNMFMGSLVIIGGIVGARIWCELMIVFFKINEALQDIRQQGKLQAQDASE